MTEQYLLGAAPVAEIYKDYDCFAYFYNKYWTINSPLYLEKALDILLLEKIEQKRLERLSEQKKKEQMAKLDIKA